MCNLGDPGKAARFFILWSCQMCDTFWGFGFSTLQNPKQVMCPFMFVLPAYGCIYTPVHGFWKPGTMTIFDVQFMDLDAAMYNHQDPTKVLAKQDQGKKETHLSSCLAQHKEFTLLVFSVDGMHGLEASASSQRLAFLLAQ